MTADEFRKILDRFHDSLQEVSVWVLMRDPQIEDHPGGLADLDQVWRDLNRECALMEEAERRMHWQPTGTGDEGPCES